MGGRGASTGISVNGKKYGTEFKNILTSGNVKFVVKLEGSVTAPRETMKKIEYMLLLMMLEIRNTFLIMIMKIKERSR